MPKRKGERKRRRKIVWDEKECRQIREIYDHKLAGELLGDIAMDFYCRHETTGEAYLRLVDVQKAQHWNSRGHCFGAAAEAMRRILVENARYRKRQKRGGEIQRVELEQVGMIGSAQEAGIPSRTLPAVDAINQTQKNVLLKKLRTLLDDRLADKTIAVWGLAFKPRTDDVREAPSLVLIEQLLTAGVAVRVFGPEALDNVKRIFGDRLTYCDRAYGTTEGADALAVVTEWQEFRNPDFEVLRRLMNRPVIVDGRNLYEPRQMAELGFTYASIGRQTVGLEAMAAAGV